MAKAKITKDDTIQIGGRDIPVIEPLPAPNVACDLIVEARDFGGNLTIGFAQIVGVSKAQARVSGRLRLSYAGAADLRNTLDGLLRAVTPAKDKTN